MSECVICDNGNKCWYEDGELHRLDGPAVENTDGYRVWYKNGERHRLDGPAVENTDGYKEWWIDGGKLCYAGDVIDLIMKFDRYDHVRM